MLLASTILMSCAGQRSPEGGPIDTEPPVIISTNPPNYTTRFKGSSITIEFNEYVDHRTVEGAVFVSPSLGPLKFDWSGRELEMEFFEKLRRSTTYVVTIGTDAADLNNHNKMAQAYTLAFSTGDDIDHGGIAGKVFGRRESDSPLGIMVFAYKLHDLNPDTLNPTTTKPDYVTQSGRNGEFALRHLSFDSYRVFAIRDEYKNLLYDPETDDYAAAPSDFAITPYDTLRSDVRLKLAREDTTATRLTKVAPTNQRHVLTEFSSAVDTSSLRSNVFRIVDTSNQSGLRVLSVYPMFPKMTTVVVTTDTQSSKAVYRLSVGPLRGANGLRLNPTASSLVFNASEANDSLPLRIQSVSLPDTSKEVELHPEISLQFSDAVEKGSVEKAITLVDSSKNTVPIAFHWLSDASVELSPTVKLASSTWYVCRVGMRNIADLFGKKGRDSLKVFRFQTMDEELYSSIEGTVHDSDSTDRKGDLVVIARTIVRHDSKEYQVRLTEDGPFALRSIVGGEYVLLCYRDRNGNKKYDSGLVHPYQSSERFVQYPDTLKVRARWPLEGVELKLH
ncbi:MAG: Ig-like domain-containing protein [Ignavibacteriales bacterium]|nr:Ig-like domain-containing protein [Ignavibacteriales bacterium]